ncbi:helix-loop-helix DNA-binding domain-containing protein [Ditylenchus destructor]|uniref:Helix-loop-helix DNA-binding domain-containing protein n=1 Tax=Ditylenchus destructor TaxID=166010 RepID=A0AAD4N671_9BILA|nr:helix-loop-helix DNA-binding domain-containing protein [Ditylenchus destructor]
MNFAQRQPIQWKRTQPATPSVIRTGEMTKFENSNSYFTSSTALFSHPSSSPPPLYSMERKIKKPLMEKKRRARMNLCFDKLKELLLQSDIQQTSKLEKADVLEKTVVYLTKLQQDNARLMQQMHQITNTDSGKAYQMGVEQGFSACMAATSETLQQMPMPNRQMLQKGLVNRFGMFMSHTNRPPNSSPSIHQLTTCQKSPPIERLPAPSVFPTNTPFNGLPCPSKRQLEQHLPLPSINKSDSVAVMPQLPSMTPFMSEASFNSTFCPVLGIGTQQPSGIFPFQAASRPNPTLSQLSSHSAVEHTDTEDCVVDVENCDNSNLTSSTLGQKSASGESKGVSVTDDSGISSPPVDEGSISPPASEKAEKRPAEPVIDPNCKRSRHVWKPYDETTM